MLVCHRLHPPVSFAKCQRAVPYELFLAKPLVPLPLIHEWLSLRTPPRSASRARARTEVFLSAFSELLATYALYCLNQRRDMYRFCQKKICSSFDGICFSGCRGKHYDRDIAT